MIHHQHHLVNVSIIIHPQKSSYNYDAHKSQYNAQGITENYPLILGQFCNQV